MSISFSHILCRCSSFIFRAGNNRTVLQRNGAGPHSRDGSSRVWLDSATVLKKKKGSSMRISERSCRLYWLLLWSKTHEKYVYWIFFGHCQARRICAPAFKTLSGPSQDSDSSSTTSSSSSSSSNHSLENRENGVHTENGQPNYGSFEDLCKNLVSKKITSKTERDIIRLIGTRLLNLPRCQKRKRKFILLWS